MNLNSPCSLLIMSTTTEQVNLKSGPTSTVITEVKEWYQASLLIPHEMSPGVVFFRTFFDFIPMHCFELCLAYDFCVYKFTWC